MPPKKQKTQEEIRGKSVKIRVNELEHEEINRRANMYGVTTSTYIRNIALNYPITSKVDHLSLMELGKCRADLGRLGGLLKMWLSNKDRRTGLDEIEVKSLYKEIEAKQEELIELARKLTEITK